MGTRTTYTFESTPDHPVGSSDMMTHEKRAEGKVIIKRVKGGHDVSERGQRGQTNRLGKERWCLGITSVKQKH